MDFLADLGRLALFADLPASELEAIALRRDDEVDVRPGIALPDDPLAGREGPLVAAECDGLELARRQVGEQGQSPRSARKSTLTSVTSRAYRDPDP